MTSLYIGVTSNLEQRIIEHYLNKGNQSTFTGKYHCYYLVYYETFQYINLAIEREKELKKWSRIKKVNLIRTINPKFEFLNKELFGKWPPEEKIVHRKI